MDFPTMPHGPDVSDPTQPRLAHVIRAMNAGYISGRQTNVPYFVDSEVAPGFDIKDSLSKHKKFP